MNAFILAGDRGRSRQVGGMNKAFLLLEGRPVLLYVLMALDRVRGIDQVYVVGPRKEIMGVIEKALPDALFSKKIEVLEQKNSLLENILYGYTDRPRLPVQTKLRRKKYSESPGRRYSSRMNRHSGELLKNLLYP